MAFYSSVLVQLPGRSPICLQTRYGSVEHRLGRLQRDIHGRKVYLSRREFRKFLKLLRRQEAKDAYWSEDW